MALEQPTRITESSTAPVFPPLPVSIMSANSPAGATSATNAPLYIADSVSPPPSTDRSNSQSPPSITSITPSLNGESESPTAAASSNQASDIDPQILEALRSKDRIYVLKLGENMEGIISDRKPRLEFPATSYQRLLVHRCSTYYKLSLESDHANKGITIHATSESRIPARRLCELVPAEATAQPAFKIMRRSLQERRPKPQSQAGSVAGEDADFSDIEPSESGSLGGRSNATGGSNKKRMTIEEREAAYNEARSRIFMDFEEKEKEKEKDMSASSSSLSLVSGSASTNGGGGSSNLGDVDDSGSSPATESEWSGPSGLVSRDKKEARRGSGNASAASSSSRSLRPSVASFNNNNGPSSSRNSRAPSPAFSYATLYEPPPTMPPYDFSQYSGQPPHSGYHPSQYIYPYSPNGQSSNPPFLVPYLYNQPFNPYQPLPPQHAQQNTPDQASSNVDLYPPQHIGYGSPYMWQHPNQTLQSQPHLQQHPHASSQPHQSANHTVSPPPPPTQTPQYQPYIPPSHTYTYPPSGYFYPQSGQHMPLPHPQMNPQSMYETPRQMNGNMGNVNNGGVHNLGTRSEVGNGAVGPPNHIRTLSDNGTSLSAPLNSGVKSRGMAPVQQRSAWSFGPGISMGGSGYNGNLNSTGLGNGEVVGPRLSSVRKQSSNSVGSSGANRPPSIGDEVSSTASSSTTSSSSRRTFTSTTSSQHPLPPRPDWAVGLKPQQTPSRYHDHNLSNSRTISPISPPRNLGGDPSHINVTSRQFSPQPVALQSTDFPPLTSLAPTQERRAPVVAGAWGNSTPARSVLLPNTGQNKAQHSVQGNNSLQNLRLEEPDRGFERPQPKSAELFNPKVARRSVNGNGNGSKVQGNKEKERARGEAVATAILVGQTASMSFEDGIEGSTSAVPREHTALLMST